MRGKFRRAAALTLLAAALPRLSLCESAGVGTLFPSLRTEDVAGVSVTTPERAFVFDTGNGAVSVNGQMADAEAFMTLLEQIAELPLGETEKFAPEEDPILSLSVEAGDEEFCACFYKNANSDAYAEVICTRGGAVRYGLTKAWRVGKLVLTCDGTRIFDENGEETPMECQKETENK